MSGTHAGGILAAKTNKKLRGEDYFKRIGSKGGQVKRPRWFALHPDLARVAGAKGGQASRRKKHAEPKRYLWNGEDFPVINRESGDGEE